MWTKSIHTYFTLQRINIVTNTTVIFKSFRDDAMASDYNCHNQIFYTNDKSSLVYDQTIKILPYVFLQ